MKLVVSSFTRRTHSATRENGRSLTPYLLLIAGMITFISSNIRIHKALQLYDWFSHEEDLQQLLDCQRQQLLQIQDQKLDAQKKSQECWELGRYKIKLPTRCQQSQQKKITTSTSTRKRRSTFSTTKAAHHPQSKNTYQYDQKSLAQNKNVRFR